MQATNCESVAGVLHEELGRTIDSHSEGPKCDPLNERVVSFQADLPIALQKAMTKFIERYPNWDQYRLIQAALAGFLVQNGVVSRSITRLYVGKMFSCESLS